MFGYHFRKTDSVYALGCAHIQHKNITRGESSWPDTSACRDFDTVAQMSDAVLDSLYSIPTNCHLFLLGDFLFGDKSRMDSILDKIPTDRIYYLYGNHCEWYRKKDKHPKVKWVGDYLEVFWGRTRVVLSHYPFAVWNESHHGSWNVCSHSHGTYPPSLPDYLTGGKILDVGWDVFKKPVSFQEIQAIMDKKYYVSLDHHNSETSR